MIPLTLLIFIAVLSKDFAAQVLKREQNQGSNQAPNGHRPRWRPFFPFIPPWMGAPQHKQPPRVNINDILPKNCAEIVRPRQDIEGVFGIMVEDTTINVYCIPDPVSGPAWTVLQRRVTRAVDFYRDWSDYEEGFGDTETDHWIGLKRMHDLTNSVEQELWVQVMDYEEESRYAKYETFHISDAADKYMLTVGKYHGNAGDSLKKHNGIKFSTFDSDNDKSKRNCAEIYKGAWWMNDCLDSHLNGDVCRHTDGDNGVRWRTFPNSNATLKYTHMAIRPAKYSTKRRN